MVGEKDTEMSIAKRLHQEVVEDRMDHGRAQGVLDRLYGDDREPCLFTMDKAENQENLGDFHA